MSGNLVPGMNTASPPPPGNSGLILAAHPIPPSLEVRVQSFYCSYRKTNSKYGKPSITIGLHGQVSRRSVNCRFDFQVGPKKTRLDFREALIYDGSDPRETALVVKQALANWVRVSPEVPESYRQELVDLVLNHHRQ